MLDPIYLVERDYGKNGTEIIGYREDTRSKVVGGDWDKVVKVLEINEDEGTCRDVTEDLRNEAAALLIAAE